MKKTLLFGAGQTGAMICRLLGARYSPLCFADNDLGKWGASLLGIPVLSPTDAIAMDPELAVLCVLDGERSSAMEKQLRALGYDGALLRPDALGVFDARAASMRLLAEQLERENIPGDIAELGVYRGDFAALMNAALPGRTLHLFDTFQGFPEADVKLERERGYSRAQAGDFAETAAELVKKRLPFPEAARFYIGRFPGTFAVPAGTRFALVSIDADLYAPTAAALPLFWERLSPGGALIVHDVNSSQYSGAGAAVREFCRGRSLLPLPLCDLHGSAVLLKALGTEP